MDKISDFFKELKDRISNPFIFSFCISWLAFNWQIIVGLFFYSIDQLSRDGYTSYIDLVKTNTNTFNSFCYPLLVALGYTFLFPLFRNLIMIFNSWNQGWGTNMAIKYSKAGKVSVLKYIQLRDIYQSRTTLLEEAIKNESSYRNEIEELKNNLLQLTSERNNSVREIEQWKSESNVGVLDGQWEFNYTADTGDKKVYRITIMQGVMHYVDNPPQHRNGTADIRSFRYRISDKKIEFIIAFDLQVEGRNRRYHYYVLNVIKQMNILRGHEDEQFPVEFRRSM